ncbi:2433_t:CDS:2 [Gigaspora margarita]|uniref:2433_t:CDS:1 n=1 Tax=Gigaspora margarita TaxID=4874 RepID=A0ABN7V963_GIGMA|nr:2433_t:CDS:2 [Gigaspora margarita]
MNRRIVKGDIEKVLKEADFALKAKQELVAKTQIVVTSVLGINANKILYRVKRIGEGFWWKGDKKYSFITGTSSWLKNLLDIC